MAGSPNGSRTGRPPPTTLARSGFRAWTWQFAWFLWSVFDVEKERATFFFVVESKTKKGWRRLLEHHYRAA
jgi:hypothetical protein